MIWGVLTTARSAVCQKGPRCIKSGPGRLFSCSLVSALLWHATPENANKKSPGFPDQAKPYPGTIWHDDDVRGKETARHDECQAV